MAGIYIHIPFCKKRCSYCDFYTEIAPKLIPSLVDAIVSELHLRKSYLQEESIKTIYFGGGTPSILSKSQFQKIIDTIYHLFIVEENAEITFEANPDDLTPEFFSSISSLPFNRISIGIQSFDDDDLKRINRRHTAQEAIIAVNNAQRAGFTNISIDLIYGLPYQTVEGWVNQLDIALSLGIQHISAYGLTYEEGTQLWKQKEANEIEGVDENTMNEMYAILLKKMDGNGFERYEISNFSLAGFRSRHNTSYWKQEPYIGVGPSAHSYNIKSRQWNIASITNYIKALNNNELFFEKEELTLFDKYNDYVMISLRTKEGIDLQKIEFDFGTELANYCLKNIKTFIDSEKVDKIDSKLRLTPTGIQISNLILTELMKL
ncbi:MAG: radical SAM family heme chaperone HemW [Paludibacter sp.]|nr:radical SAM family heme chaperone HemW [Paludibacter sp.]